MNKIMNWICLACISFLVLDVMIYFCKDALNLIKVSKKQGVRTYRRVHQQMYKDKLAK